MSRSISSRSMSGLSHSTHMVQNPSQYYKDISAAQTMYTHEVYRPVDAIHIRSTQEFAHPYNVLYPVHSVATFEKPIQWRHRGAERGSSSTSSSSESGSLSFSMKPSSSMMPSRSGNLVNGEPKKKSKGCCGRKPKAAKPVEGVQVVKYDERRTLEHTHSKL
eukprot:GHVH01010182.1.p1 GENE.GHVH01010182.1~~GHVH01010182.1.p1  ORF type:complete len:162 (+),score=21.11 GHVH01010182.1:82-567(+)